MKLVWEWCRSISLLLIVFVSASLYSSDARAGNIYVVDCTTCTTIDNFKSWAGYTAAQRGIAGTYLVIGPTLSAYIRVAGQRATTCTPNGECTSYLKILSLQSISSGGANAPTDSDLANNDTELFGTTRVDKLPPVTLPENYQTSIVNSYDEEIGPGISFALVQLNINPGTVRIGTEVTVKFKDGTKATFRKISNSTEMWIWTGKAWDKDGNPINRDGSPKTNPNPPGGGFGGSVETNVPNRDGSNVVYTMTTSTKCLFRVGIFWHGVWGYWYGWLNCN
ncbi:MAG: hypothetical protein ABI769_17275 [Pseudomonadota bacterium]